MAKKPGIFSAKKIEFSQPQIDERELSLKETYGVDGGHFRQHVAGVKGLTDKIIDLFETQNYDITVALDALETILKGGVELSLGDEASELLDKHLKQFHKELMLLQIMQMLERQLGPPADDTNLMNGDFSDIGMDAAEASAALKKKLDEMK